MIHRKMEKKQILVNRCLPCQAEITQHREYFDQTHLAKFPLAYLARIFSTELTKNSFGFSIRC